MLKRSKPMVDEENPEWTKEDFAKAVRIDGLPKDLQAILSKGRRGPQNAPTKVPVSIRLSTDVITALRASGGGWQSRVDDALRTWLKQDAKVAK